MYLTEILTVNSLYDLTVEEYEFLYDMICNMKANEEELSDVVDFLCKDLSNAYHRGMLIIIRRSLNITEKLQLKIKAHQYLKTLPKPS